MRENPGRLPVPFARFDMLTVAASAIALLFWIVQPDGTGTGVALAVAGAMQTIRLARWAGDRTARERLLLILHIGYAFVPLGFLLGAAAAFGQVPAAAGIHAWMAGAAGVMTLAVMSRASLGHTGQPLTASAATQAIYVAIIIAAAARICAVLEPAHSLPLLYLAALAWAAAFWICGLLWPGAGRLSKACGARRPSRLTFKSFDLQSFDGGRLILLKARLMR